MRYSISALFALIAACLLVAGATAADKEVTLKGQITCAKCELKEAKKCETVIQVTEGDKVVTYYFMDKGNKETYHKNICQGEKKGSVTGTVAEKDGKKWITPAKDGVKYDE